MAAPVGRHASSTLDRKQGRKLTTDADRATAPESTVPPWDTALLDAIPDAIAVLDTRGVIKAVNRAWRMFTLDNGGNEVDTGVDVDYFGVCQRSSDNGCADATEVLAALQAVLGGESVERDVEYPCPSPAVGRWFVLRITRVDWPGVGLLISHTNISVRKVLEQDLERTALQDPLTRLANRAHFDQALAQALTPRPHRPTIADVGLLYMDLDGFKPINDTYGHAMGDEVLQTVATRLSKACRPQDTVARLGGDEFAIVAPRINAAGLAHLAARIREVISAPHRIHGSEVVVNVSVGTHLASSGEDCIAALNHADEAMYEQKRHTSADGTDASTGV